MCRRKARESNGSRLPLRCYGCGLVFEKWVSSRVKWVICPACGGMDVHVLSPVKILDLRRTPHYNTPKKWTERDEERGEPLGVLRAVVPEPVYLEDVEIVEEIV